MTNRQKEIIVSIVSTTLCLLSAGLVVSINASRLEALTILVVTLAAVYSMFFWLDSSEED